MSVFVIYNKKSGKIVHTHFQPIGFPNEKEWALSQVDHVHNRSNLDIIEIDESYLGEDLSFIVDVKTKKLKPAKGKAGSPIATAEVNDLIKSPEQKIRQVKFISGKENK